MSTHAAIAMWTPSVMGQQVPTFESGGERVKCPKRRLVTSAECMDGYVDAEAHSRKGDPCYHCKHGRARRDQFAGKRFTPFDSRRGDKLNRIVDILSAAKARGEQMLARDVIAQVDSSSSPSWVREVAGRFGLLGALTRERPGRPSNKESNDEQ